jgi:hypothetical protein
VRLDLQGLAGLASEPFCYFNLGIENARLKDISSF